MRGLRSGPGVAPGTCSRAWASLLKQLLSWEGADARLRACGVLCAAQNGFRVVRMFGFPVQEGFNLQTSAGVFNPLAFKGLDIAVAEAAKNNLRLVVALMNNWNYNPLQTDWKCARRPCGPRHFISSANNSSYGNVEPAVQVTGPHAFRRSIAVVQTCGSFFAVFS